MKYINRRFVFLCMFIFCLCAVAAAQTHTASVIAAIEKSNPVVQLADGSIAEQVTVQRTGADGLYHFSLTNTGRHTVKIKQVQLFSANKLFSANTPLYGEGFQMLSQTAGSLAQPKDIGQYTDNGHYHLPQPAGYKTVYNLLLINAAPTEQYLMAFTSCKKFVGKFELSADTIKVMLDADNISLQPGATLALEEFMIATGSSRPALFSRLSTHISRNHPRAPSKPIPSGWCSWYCFGPEVTVNDINRNMAFIQKNIPQLKYIQIDDGYQSHMGDWLETGKSFGGSIQKVLKGIRQQGFEPAIWVAPFICDSNSLVYQQHPDWLVKDSTGKPLRSDKVSFGGWRLAPWYVLDGTNPAVQQHLTSVFAKMREEWGCTYFKMDANFWGAIQGGVFYDRNATRVTAYRSGMKAIRKGAGNAFLLGCNHPLWPSLGLIDGSRSSLDIDRSWESFTSVGRENLYRNWQNGKLWWNDPDCIVLTGKLTDDEFSFHASLIFATGGMVLSGDDLTTITPERLAILQKCLPPSGRPASFENDAFETGTITTPKGRFIVLLNWTDEAKSFTVPLPEATTVTDYFAGKSLGKYQHRLQIQLNPRAGKILQLSGETNR